MTPAAARRRLSARTIPALLLAAVVAVPLVATAVVVGPAHADEPGGSVVEPESPDFATEVYGDPWDYSNVQDQNTDASSTHGISISGGKLKLVVAGGDWFDPITSQPNALSNGRDGNRLPVDTTRYTRLSFDMDQDMRGFGRIMWFTCGALLPSCSGGLNFGTKIHDNVYDIDLTRTSILGAKIPWKGSRIVGLRVYPTISAFSTARVDSTFDWMRLYDPETAHGALPPGDYPYSGVTVQPRPVTVVDSPNDAQGADVTTAQRRPQWLFTRSANKTRIKVLNATVRGYGAAGLTATNAGRLRNDPQILLPISKFAGSSYRYLSFSMTYNGAFGLADAPGGGKMSRLIWNVKGTSTLQESNDIVTYGGVNAQTVSIDLASGRVLDENSRPPKQGWAGQTITSLRFDPNEDPGAATWHLKAIHLRKAPAAKGATIIRFHDAAWVDGTTAQIDVKSGSKWRTLTTGLPVTSGSNAYRWALGGLPAGSYGVRVTLTHPDGSTDASSSSAPITMSK